MESQPQDPEFRINPENFDPWQYYLMRNGICIRYSLHKIVVAVSNGYVFYDITGMQYIYNRLRNTWRGKTYKLIKVQSKTCLKPTLKNRQNKDLNEKW